MAQSVGAIVEKATESDALARARLRAALLPDLLVEAQKIANSVTTGWHGRRRRGIGDTFWQFRPYDLGESLARIDWRRSARDDAITIRDQEWEAAHTVWVWANNGASMLYKSHMADVSKQSRALVIALATAETLARSGERVGWPGVTRALSSRSAAERIATDLTNSTQADDIVFPNTAMVSPRSEVVVVSDFLDPLENITRNLLDLAERGIRGSLVQVIDPAEEHFPYGGRTEFIDPQTGQKLTIGRAENVVEDYQRLFQSRQTFLADQCRKLGWFHIIHHTDRPASTALTALHERLSGQIGLVA